MWAAPSPAQKYGGAQLREQRATTDDTALNRVEAPAPQVDGGMLTPPLLVFGVLAAATVGLMAYSTSVRVGPASATIALGK